MTTRGTKLNRLAIASECEVSWDGMERDGCRRYCAECQRTVFDLSLMTPAEIHAHLEASRGNLCARITRIGGRLVTAPPPLAPAEPEPSWIRRRVSAVAAGLVTAWLGAAALEAQPDQAAAAGVGVDDGAGAPDASPARRTAATPRSALYGRVATDEGSPLGGVVVVARNTLDDKDYEARTGADGGFRFTAVPAGVYELYATPEGYSTEPQEGIVLQPGEERPVDVVATAEVGHAMGGAIVAAAEPLRTVYRDSDVVAVVTFGDSAETKEEGGLHQVDTVLDIGSSIKGKVRGRTVTLRHTEYSDGDDGGWRAEYAAGKRALVFLKSVADGGDAAIFESADAFGFGIRRLDDAAIEALVRRLEALARLERAADLRGEGDPADVAEWLVGTAEDPVTRGEATGELESAMTALSKIAAERETSADLLAVDLQALVDRFRGDGGVLSANPRPELLAAFLTTAQRKRLTAALEATPTARYEDVELFMVVRGWDEKAATSWLVRQLGKEPASAKDQEVALPLGDLAWKLGDETLTELTDAADERAVEIRNLWPDDQSEAAAERRRELLAALDRELRHDFAAALAAKQ